MIVSKPKRSTLFALSVFLILVLLSFFLVFDSLLRSADYFYVKLILAPVLLVIALVVFSKLAKNLKTVTIAKEKIEVKNWLSGKITSFTVAQILGWREDVVRGKNGDFKEIRIAYGRKEVLKLSNKESTDYDRVHRYLIQKAKKKKSAG